MQIPAMITVLFFVALFTGCKTRETAPLASDDPHLAKGPVPIEPACSDNDSDCPAGYYCDRDGCSNYFGRDNRSKLFLECVSEKECVEDDGKRWICHRGRCRSCLKAEECAPGGEAAGWFCWGGHCSTSPPERGRPPVKDIPFPPIPSAGSPPLPLPPAPTATTWPTPPN
jgi:hypothetical protein